MSINIAQQDSQIKRLRYEDLQQMLRQMTQAGQIGTPAHILVAGEIQARNDARQKAMAGQGNPIPVISDLLTGGAMPMAPQAPMAPEDAGGIANLPAPNMDNINAMAAGGLVAFSNGGDVKRRFEALPRYVGQEAGIPGAQITNFFKSRMRGDTRIDPVTGQPVTFGEFVRLEDQRAAAAARTPAVDAIPAGTAVSSPGAITAGQPRDESFISGLFRAAAPGISAPPSAQTTLQAVPVSAEQNRALLNQTDAALRSQPGAAPPAGPEPEIRLRPRPEAPSDVSPINIGAVPDATAQYDKAKTFVTDLFGTAPTRPNEVNAATIKKDVEDTRNLFKELGIEDPTKLRREQLEKEMKEAKSERKQAGYAWLANFGFNWAAQNGPTLQAMAKAGVQTVPGLMSDLKDLNKLNREQRKELAGLAALDAQAQRDMTLKARDRLSAERERIEARIDQRNKDIATASVSLAANAVSNQTQLMSAGIGAQAQLQAARIGAASRRYEVDTAERRINAMPGATYQEKLTNYYKAVTPRATVATDELDKAAADLAKDPIKLEQLKSTNPALYALMVQRINLLAVPNVTGTPTGTVRN